MSKQHRKTVKMGEQAARSGTVEFNSFLSDDAPQEFQRGECEGVEREEYETSIREARKFVAASEPNAPANGAASTIRQPDYYHRQLKKLLKEHDDELSKIIKGARGKPLEMGLAKLSRKAAAIGAMYADGATLAGLKDDRDKQMAARSSHSRHVIVHNKNRALLCDSEIEIIRQTASSIPGHDLMSKKAIHDILRTRPKTRDIDNGLSSDAFNRALGDGFGQRKKRK